MIHSNSSNLLYGPGFIMGKFQSSFILQNTVCAIINDGLMVMVNILPKTPPNVGQGQQND